MFICPITTFTMLITKIGGWRLKIPASFKKIFLGDPLKEMAGTSDWCPLTEVSAYGRCPLVGVWLYSVVLAYCTKRRRTLTIGTICWYEHDPYNFCILLLSSYRAHWTVTMFHNVVLNWSLPRERTICWPAYNRGREDYVQETHQKKVRWRTR